MTVEMGESTEKNLKYIDSENRLLVAGGKDKGEGIVREFGMDTYTLLYF